MMIVIKPDELGNEADKSLYEAINQLVRDHYEQSERLVLVHQPNESGKKAYRAVVMAQHELPDREASYGDEAAYGGTAGEALTAVRKKLLSRIRG